jgi:hypothetical protein
MRNHKFGFIYGIFFLALACLTFSGCAGPVQELQTVETTGAVRVTVGDGARTLIPALPSIGSYRFSFESLETPPRETVNRDVYDYYLYLNLTVGSWNLTVTAFDYNGIEIARGSSLVVVTSGTTNYVTVQLGNEPGVETGSLSYSVSFPSTVTRASLRLTSLSGGADSSPVNLLAGSAGTLNVAAGNYLLNVDLYDSSLGNAGKTEVVHIYSNTTTTGTYAFNSSDFGATVTSYQTGSQSLSAALNAIRDDTSGSADYTVILTQNESFAPYTLGSSFSGKRIRIRGNCTLTLSGTGSLFTVETGVALILHDVTLQGRSDNTSALISVTGGDLLMNPGTTITGNTISSYGGGVYLYNGTFTMSGGTITGNTSSNNGGGVYVSYGALTMSGGTISGNTTTSSYGGGVYVYNGTFTISGGTISGNAASYYGGGGVCMSGSALTMSGGTITGNSSYYYGGGGVYLEGGTFAMSGGTITGNSSYYGGGVYVTYNGALTMSGGTISGNSASYGGGVYVDSVYNNTSFTKQSGGVIYGSDAGSVLSNTATYGDYGDYGDAVYVSNGKRRNATAGTGVTVDSSVSGSVGGWISPFSEITYSTLDYTWNLESDGRRRSPTIDHYGITKARINFTTTSADANMTIQLDVSSESGYDYAFISTLDNPDATFNSGYYAGSVISGNPSSATVTIPIPTAGSHFIDIGYRKDQSVNTGSDCAWFKVLE